MKKQRGMTLIGMVFTMAVVVIVAIIVMRIIPVYIQHYSIMKSAQALNSVSLTNLSGDPLGDASVLRASLTKRLDINGIEDLKVNEVMIVPHGPNKYTVKLKYQVIRPLVYNMKLLFDFDDSIEVVAGSEQ